MGPTDKTLHAPLQVLPANLFDGKSSWAVTWKDVDDKVKDLPFFLDAVL